MPFVAATVEIPESIQPILLKYAKSRTLPARQVQRAKLILLAAEGLNNMQISKQIGLGQDSVSRWRTRYLKSLPLLQEIAEKDPSLLEDAVDSLLNDRPRPGQPRHYTDEQITKILEVACRNPEDFGYESSHWSLKSACECRYKRRNCGVHIRKNSKSFFKMREKFNRIASATGFIPQKKWILRRLLRKK